MASPATSPNPYDDERPVDDTDQLLVAYLDGELDDNERRDLESRLVNEQGLRRRLSHLQSGWELLDYLPPTSVTDDFARTTIEMVAASESTMLKTQKKKRPWKGIGWLAAVLLASTALAYTGYSVPVALQEQRFDKQLADLPIAENLDAYLVDVDLKLIEQLTADPTWQDAINLALESGSLIVKPPVTISHERPELLLTNLSTVDRQDKLLLSTNWERFNNYPEDRKQQLRQRAAEVAATEDPAKTLKTLTIYAQWFNQLWPEAQDSILKAKPDERLPLIHNLTQQMSRRWLREYGSAISESDRDLIYDCLKLIAKERLARFAQQREQQKPEERNRAFDQFQRMDDPVAFLRALPWFWGQILRGPQRNEPPDPIVEGLIGLLTDEELTDIEEIMSRKSLVVLNSQTSSLENRRQILHEWCSDIINQKSPRFDTPERMLQHYRNLPPEARKSLDLREPEDIIDAIRGGRGRFRGR